MRKWNMTGGSILAGVLAAAVVAWACGCGSAATDAGGEGDAGGDDDRDVPPIDVDAPDGDAPDGDTVEGDDGGTEATDAGDADADADADAEAMDDGDGEIGDGEETPPTCVPTDEICGTGIDEDCDTFTDEEECLCRRGLLEACYDGPWGTLERGMCRGGARACGDGGVWSDCAGQVLPGELPEATCDGIDNDCDGAVDNGVANPCGTCGPTPPERCGNSLDDDCDGAVDEGCLCDPLCLLPDPTQCRPPTNQPCYEGLPTTLGFGICRGGLHDCSWTGGIWSWTTCRGQVLPAPECSGGVANGVDDDCDGLVDEDCLPDRDGDGFPPPADCNDGDASVFPGAAEVCDGIDNDCDGVPDDGVTNGCGGCWTPDPDEICGDGYDNDCDGLVEEGCVCTPGDERWCYSGPPGTEDRAPCRVGEQVCLPGGQNWGPCVGQIVPGLEVCDGVDNDCDGLTDERGAAGANPCGECVFTELCDGVDNDCDGLTDEMLRNACGDCLPVPPETACDGIDNDCDGLTDEGLVNACGLCPPAECFETPYPDPGECGEPGRTCDGLVPWPDDPTSITLGQGTLSNPYIYVALDGRNQVAKLNTETGVKIWQVSSHGTSPSRTAVALDHTVWVANRGFANPNDPAHSNVVHLDADG
ncbi:MAG: putative metal-binding motif-containing protein, partial [Myxococcota bacterium]|nr:putative metal-binding motif-containing protein [Myxococcota bacterium]